MADLDLNATKKCPKCEQPKPIREGFGTRMQHGRTTAQSYCRECRSSKKVKPEVIGKNALPVAQGGPCAVIIPGNKDRMRELYKEHFPADSNGDKRAWKIMAQKVAGKLNRQNIKWISECSI